LHTPNPYLPAAHQEAEMVAKNAREVLSKENELLEELIAKAETYVQANDGLMAEVCNGWVAGLTRHRDINAKLICDTDSDFDDEVTEEIDLLEHLVATIEKKGGGVTGSWLDHLNDDLTFLKELL
jgi:hypothetical protein